MQGDRPGSADRRLRERGVAAVAELGESRVRPRVVMSVLACPSSLPSRPERGPCRSTLGRTTIASPYENMAQMHAVDPSGQVRTNGQGYAPVRRSVPPPS